VTQSRYQNIKAQISPISDTMKVSKYQGSNLPYWYQNIKAQISPISEMMKVSKYQGSNLPY
jgi:hypothetical protein